MKALQEQKELPTRQVFLRRIGLSLVRIKVKKQLNTKKGKTNEEVKFEEGEEFLYKFPLLEYVEETSKIMLLSESELIYWFILLRRYLEILASDESAVQDITAT